jgi:hypothetical protein
VGVCQEKIYAESKKILKYVYLQVVEAKNIFIFNRKKNQKGCSPNDLVNTAVKEKRLNIGKKRL